MLENFRHNAFMYRILFQTKMFLDGYSSLYISILKFHRRNQPSYQDIVCNDTDIVIDGYPRSANSFASEAFKIAQTKPIKIATHVHVSSQIIQACKKGIPTLVLIRHPKDAAVSWKCLSLEVEDEATVKKTPISIELKAYIYFYKRIFPYRNQFVLGNFNDVTSNFSKVMQEINCKFATNFDIFEHTKENEQKIFSSSGFHLSPSSRRNSYKKMIYEEIEHPKNAKLLHKAEQIYHSFTKD